MMRAYKRGLWLLLAMVLVVSCVSLTALAEGTEIVDSGSCGENVTWTLDADGVLTISGTGEIDSSAFEGDDTIKQVVVESGVTSIGNSAFMGCDGLTSVTLPESVTWIGHSAFRACDAMQGIWVDPKNLNYSSDDWGVLFDKGMTTLLQAPGGITGDYTAPEGLNSIEDYAFECCKSLTGVTLPEELTSIGVCVFHDCDSLTGVTIPKNVTSIGHRAFGYCGAMQGIWVDPANLSYGSDDRGVLFDKGMTTLLQAPGGITGEYTAPEGLTSIGEYAFASCESLTSVTLPEGLTSIGEAAFHNCTSMTSVSLPKGLTSLEYAVFHSCESLTNVTLPEGMSIIGDSAFNFCKSLTSVTLPESVTSIEGYSFAHCENLSGVTLPVGLTSIGDCAFGDCESLSDVTLPERLASIGEEAFRNCDSLTSVTIPKNVTSIGSFAFRGCDAMQGIWVDQENQSYSNDDRGVLFDKGKTVLIQAPGAITGEYIAPEGLSSIGRGAFYLCKSLTSVTLPESVTSIGGSTFYRCDSLTSVTLPEGLTSIGGHAFFSAGLTSVTIPEGLTSIEEYAFFGCDLESIIFRGCAPVIDDFAFGNVVATAYYPANDPSWTSEVMRNYDGWITWVPLGIQDIPQIQFCYSQKQDSVRVQWDLVDGAEGYQLYRSTTPEDDSSWKCVKTITDGTKNTYTNQGLTEGVTYYYKVRAYAQGTDGRVYSIFSDVKHMPAAVVWDSPYSNSSFRIRLRWNEVDGAHGYQIWRKDEGGSYRIVKTIGDKGNTLTNDQGGVTAYGNTGLTAGSRYTYKMRAFYITEDGGKVYGAYSDEVTVAVQPVAPGITVTSSAAGRARIRWESVAGANGYQIWMSEAEDSGFAIAKSITDGSVSSYNKNGLESGKIYYFKIRAYVEVDGKKSFGAYSQTVAVTVK